MIKHGRGEGVQTTLFGIATLSVEILQGGKYSVGADIRGRMYTWGAYMLTKFWVPEENGSSKEEQNKRVHFFMG